MNPVIGQCPICADTLHVRQLHCRNCDTTVQGHFSLGRLYLLTPEQLSFVETFLRCEGKIKWVEKELDLSYPAVRSRLLDVIRGMGYEVESVDSHSITDEKRKQVLNELSEGQIDAEQALAMLRGDG